MKTLILIIITLFISICAQARGLHPLSIQRSHLLMDFMDDIDISVEASGAFRFNDNEFIVRGGQYFEQLSRNQVASMFFEKAAASELGYSVSKLNAVWNQFKKMMGAPLGNGKFQVITSYDSVMYYDVEYIAVRGAHKSFTLEFASEN